MLRFIPLAGLYVLFAMSLMQVALSLLLLYRNSHKRYPAFCGYVYFATLKSLFLLAVACLAEPSLYPAFYYGLSFTSDLLALAVAWEVYRVVYGPTASLPACVPVRASQIVSVAFISAVLISGLFRASRGGTFTRAMVTVEGFLIWAAFFTFWGLLLYSKTLFMWWNPRISGIATGFILFLTINIAAVHVRGSGSLGATRIALLAGPVAYLASLGLWMHCHWRAEQVPTPATDEEFSRMSTMLAHAASMMILEDDTKLSEA